MTEFKPLHYIGAKIQAEFDQDPLLIKEPGCPDRFFWEGQVFQITEKLGEWHDFSRTGNMAHNMRPANQAKAIKRGSWGVGRYYFRVKTDSGRLFELYYDRAPRHAGDRAGSWYLDRELEKVTFDLNGDKS